MSLSSVAQDSALRLTAGSVAAPSRREIAEAAATAAASAVAEGADAATAAAAGRDAGEGVEGAAPTVPSGPLATLVKWIPTETITVYIAIQAALGDVTAPQGKPVSDADFTSRWVWVAIVFGITIILGLALSYRAQKVAHPGQKFKVPYFDVGAAGVAFLVWALSLPTTPLRDIEGYDYSAWNSVLILIGTLAIGTAAYAAGKAVTWDKVLTDSVQ